MRRPGNADRSAGDDVRTLPAKCFPSSGTAPSRFPASKDDGRMRRASAWTKSACAARRNLCGSQRPRARIRKPSSDEPLCGLSATCYARTGGAHSNAASRTRLAFRCRHMTVDTLFMQGKTWCTRWKCYTWVRTGELTPHKESAPGAPMRLDGNRINRKIEISLSANED